MTDGSPKEARQRGVMETEMMEMEVLADPCAGLDVGPGGAGGFILAEGDGGLNEAEG